MITFARDRRRAGDSVVTATVTAARGRLRPIVMTGLAMIAGMIPVALGIGEGGDQNAPLGLAVVGGLAASMIAAIVFLPALYAIFARKGSLLSPSLDPDDPSSPSSQPEGRSMSPTRLLLLSLWQRVSVPAATGRHPPDRPRRLRSKSCPSSRSSSTRR